MATDPLPATIRRLREMMAIPGFPTVALFNATLNALPQLLDAAEASRWIPVEESLPGDGLAVEVWRMGHWSPAAYGWRKNGQWFAGPYAAEHVSHWRRIVGPNGESA